MEENGKYTVRQLDLIDHVLGSFPACPIPVPKTNNFPTAYLVVDLETSGVDSKEDLVIEGTYALFQEAEYKGPKVSENFLYSCLASEGTEFTEESYPYPRSFAEGGYFGWNQEDLDFDVDSSVVARAMYNVDRLSGVIEHYPTSLVLFSEGDAPDFAFDTVQSAIVAAREADIPIVMHGAYNGMLDFWVNTGNRIPGEKREDFEVEHPSMILDTGALEKALGILREYPDGWGGDLIQLPDDPYSGKEGEYVPVICLLDAETLRVRDISYFQWVVGVHRIVAKGVRWSTDHCIQQYPSVRDVCSFKIRDSEVLPMKSELDCLVIHSLLQEWRQAIGKKVLS